MCWPKNKVYMRKQTRIRIFVTGGNGFIGSIFLAHLKKVKNIDVTALDHKTLDILDVKKLDEVFDTIQPHVVVNFAAHRNANTAELERGNRAGFAWKTNVEGVKNILKVSQKYKSYLIHISTDMVFSGRSRDKGPYDENKPPQKNNALLSWYGFTKAEGERVLHGKKNTAIIRIGNVTAPVYDPKLDYVGKIIYLYDQKLLYPLFDDQQLTLTSIPHLFRIIERLIQKRLSGVFHATSIDTFTPHELGLYVVQKMRSKKAVISKISIDTYLETAPNRYPKYGGLIGKYTQKKLRITSLRWREIIDAFPKSFTKNRITQRVSRASRRVQR